MTARIRKTDTLSIRLRPATKERLQFMAATAGISVASMVEWLVNSDPIADNTTNQPTDDAHARQPAE